MRNYFAQRMGIVNAFFACLFLLLLLSVAGCKKDMDSGVSESPNAMKFGNKELSLQLVAENLASPLGLREAPDGSKRLFIYDQSGKIFIIDSSGTQLATPFLDISSRMVSLMPAYDERGLTGFAFHPDFANNGKFYIYYQAPAVNALYDHTGRVSMFHANAGANSASPASEQVILEWQHPQFNHNGGAIAFGPDGYLYIAIGDGGGANDTAFAHVEDWYLFNDGGNGQDIDSNFLGGILRIDVNSGSPYSIPPDNPFAGSSHNQLMYAYGMRNPYNFSFDMGGMHDLIAMDAGQNRYEEINLVMKGSNYGWNVKEGSECFDASDGLAEVQSCPSADVLGNPLIDPVIEINNWLNPEGGRATTIIAGYVYRGDEISGLKGKYLFGTFSQTPTTANGELFIANPHGKRWQYDEINIAGNPNDIGYYLKGFGQDLSGEVYLTVSSVLGPLGSAGKVYKLVETK